MEVLRQPILTQTGNHQHGSQSSELTIAQAVRVVDSTVGPYLHFGISDGETNIEGQTPEKKPYDFKRDEWVVGPIQKLEAVPGIDIISPGGYRDYDDFPRHVVTGPLNPESLPLEYAQIVRLTLPVMREALGDTLLRGYGLQIGIPGYRQIPSFAFGQYKPLLMPKKYQRPFTAATRQNVAALYSNPEILRFNPGIQFEHPVETLAALEAYRKGKILGGLAARFMASGIASQYASLHAKARTAIHLCYGRFKGHAAPSAPDPSLPGVFEPVVGLANHTVQKIAETHTPPAVFSIPLLQEGGGMVGQGAIREIVAQMKDLNMPRRTAIAFGIATQHTDAEDIARFGDALQNGLGRPILVSSPCGKGSMSADQGHALLQKEAQAVALLRGSKTT